jgi:hypothetical protein
MPTSEWVYLYRFYGVTENPGGLGLDIRICWGFRGEDLVGEITLIAAGILV